MEWAPSLEGSPLGVFLHIGPGGDKGSSTAEIGLRLGDGNHGLFDDFQTGGRLMTRQVFALHAATVGTGTDVDERQVEGVVHLEVFIGVEHATQTLQEACHATFITTPFPGGQTPTVISVA